VRKHLVKELTLFVGNIIGDLQAVDIAEGYSNPFGLSTRETTGEVRVSEETGCEEDDN
jgi:hypothetical protein